MIFSGVRKLPGQMKKQVKKFIALLAVLSLGLCALSSTSEAVSETAVPDTALSDIVSCAETILSKADGNFIGHHPINENFICYVASLCGEQAVKDIAAGNDFSDPEVWYRETGNSIHVLWDGYCRQTGISYYQTTRTKVLSVPDGQPAKFVFTGDIGMGENLATTKYMTSCKNGLADCFSADLLSEMKGADVLTINNEFPYTDWGTALAGKTYTFRAHPGRVQELKKIGVDLVSLANNHVFDYGEEGILDTFETLEKAGYPYIGAGRNIEDATEPYSFIACGRKITICSATQIERSAHFTQEATDSLPGVIKTLHPERFCAEIQKAKKTSDIVIVFVHWGTEGMPNYGADQTALAHAFVSAGADAIVGGHTHCLEAVEYVDGVPCFYSLGNYWFTTEAENPGSYDTGLAEITIGGDGIESASFLPCHFENGVTAETTDAAQKESQIAYMNSLSKTAVIGEDGKISPKQ